MAERISLVDQARAAVKLRNGTLGRVHPSQPVDPETLATALHERCNNPNAAAPSVEERLTRKFGLGDAPDKRRKLYRKLQALAARHGETVLTLISEAVASSVGTRAPGKYFSKAIAAKLATARLDGTGTEGGDASW